MPTTWLPYIFEERHGECLLLDYHIYLKKMIFKLESFVKRIRWKAFFYEKSDNTPETIVDNFGFKSVRAPPKNEHLNAN